MWSCFTTIYNEILREVCSGTFFFILSSIFPGLLVTESVILYRVTVSSFFSLLVAFGYVISPEIR